MAQGTGLAALHYERTTMLTLVRIAYLTTSFTVDLEMLGNITDAFKATIETLKPVPGLIYSLSFQSLSKSLLSESASRGGNSLGLSSESGPLVVMLLFSSWANTTDDDLVISTQQTLINNVDAMAKDQGKSSAYRYMPYAYVGQDVLSGYGEEVETKLKAASQKYDAEGFFQQGVPGGFKLGR
jgi:hypothetical protein